MSGERAGRVIVGISETLAGYQALRYAVGEVRRRGGELIAVRAYSYSHYGAASQFQGLLEDAAQTIVTCALTEALGGPPRDIRIRVVLREGRPGQALTEPAVRTDDLIVIGGSRRSSLIHSRGRVARDCSRMARCPVVVVPAPEMAFIGSAASLARRTVEAAQALADGHGGPVGPAAAAGSR